MMIKQTADDIREAHKDVLNVLLGRSLSVPVALTVLQTVAADLTAVSIPTTEGREKMLAQFVIGMRNRFAATDAVKSRA